ncbi:MAG: hypothetical protein ACRDIC_16130 [bacterium]
MDEERVWGRRWFGAVTQDYTALAIAAVFALAGLLPLIAGGILRPITWLCLLSGVGAGFFAREATALAWEVLGPLGGLSNSPGGSVVHQMLATGIGELLKAIVPLTVILWAATHPSTGLSYGAAAGAGFALINAQRVLVRVLELVGSPIVTPLSTALAVIGWFFTILGHITTTGYLTWAAAGGGFGRAFLVAWGIQFALLLAQRLPVVAGVPLSLPVSMIVTLMLLYYLRGLRARPANGIVPNGRPAPSASEP